MEKNSKTSFSKIEGAMIVLQIVKDGGRSPSGSRVKTALGASK